MKYGPLVLVMVGIITMLFSAASFAQPAPCDITAKVAFLKPGFDPVTYGNCASSNCPAQSPDNYISTPVTPNYLNDIGNAFGIASPLLQNDLCGDLDYIFIDTDPANKPLVWGLRERAHGNRIHVAINQQVLNDLENSLNPYSYYENKYIFYNLLNHQKINNLYYMTATPDNLKVAVLAILAHEYGHVIWWDKHIDQQKCTNDYRYYYQYSNWPNYYIGRGFHRFGQLNNGQTNDQPDVYRVLQDLDGQQPNPNSAISDLRKIYSGEWASLFATVSLDEDFIETYKLWVLTQPQTGLTNLPIHFPDQLLPNPIDVVSNFNNSQNTLYMKGKWVETWRTDHRNCTGPPP